MNFSDWVAASGRPRYTGYLPYYVAKRAIMGLTEALALELAADYIFVNAIAPGRIRRLRTRVTKSSSRWSQLRPSAAGAGEAEIANAVVFLLESGFVTGETIRVLLDGGRHVR